MGAYRARLNIARYGHRSKPKYVILIYVNLILSIAILYDKLYCKVFYYYGITHCHYKCKAFYYYGITLYAHAQFYYGIYIALIESSPGHNFITALSVRQ
jgi:hypothetical protein